ncbi:MAG: nucleoside recognition domain-containing protein [Clostridia bacterium]|nr:nucleoside recognition domain-containing protein [Clostridia bacterium]
MMNILWSVLVLISIGFSIMHATVADTAVAVFSAAQEAVELTLKILGMFCFWDGIMEIAQRGGVTDCIQKMLSPLLNLLFPNHKNDDTVKSAIAMNMTANILGLGNAATPLGLEAMRRLKANERCKDTATNDMIRFVVLNTASIRLIPTTVAMLRFEAGSASPMEILPVSAIVSLLSCSVGLLICRAAERFLHE